MPTPLYADHGRPHAAPDGALTVDRHQFRTTTVNGPDGTKFRVEVVDLQTDAIIAGAIDANERTARETARAAASAQGVNLPPVQP